MSLVVILDGITFQHAAELLLDIGVSAAGRGQAAHTYARCLEDSISALLFADKAGLPAKLPPVGSEYPGETLKGKLRSALPDCVFPISQIGSPGDLETLVRGDITLADLVLQDIGLLADAYKLGKQYWDECIFREAHGYLLADPSLDIAKRYPEIRKQNKTHYVLLDEIELKVPKDFYLDLTQIVRKTGLAPDATKEELR